MADMNVTYADMHTSAGKLTSGQAQIEQMLQTLKREVDGLVTSGYVTDKSSKAFQSSYEEFNKGITQVIHGLSGMAKFLKGAANQMQQIDEQLASTLK